MLFSPYAETSVHAMALMFVKENIYIQSLKKTNLAKNIQDKTILYGLQVQYFSIVVF